MNLFNEIGHTKTQDEAKSIRADIQFCYNELHRLPAIC